MNRIFTLMIALPLIISGSNVFAKKPARSPGKAQQTEAILYANEHTSNVPRYRGDRKPSNGDASKTVPALGRNTNAYTRPQPTLALKPLSPPKKKERLSQPKVTEAAPVILGSSHRLTRKETPTPPTEISDLQHSQLEPRRNEVQSAQKTALALPIERSQVTEAAPVIDRSSRRLTKMETPTPPTEIPDFGPEATVPAQTQTNVAKTRSRFNASSKINLPNFKVRRPSDYGQKDLQQSQWTPRRKQVQSAKTVVSSSRVEQSPTDDSSDLFDVVSSEFSNENSPVAAFSKPASLGSEAESPSTFFIAETATPLAGETDRTIELAAPVAPVASVDKRLATNAKVRTTKKVRTFAGKESSRYININTTVSRNTATLSSEEASPLTSFIAEATAPAFETKSRIEAVAPVASAATALGTKAKVRGTEQVHLSASNAASRQETATGAWWLFLPLLVVPFLAWLGWALFAGPRKRQFAKPPTIEIPRQKNTPWQGPEDSDAELSFQTETETRSRGFPALRPETELLDEINSVSLIAFNSNLASNSTSDMPAKSEI